MKVSMYMVERRLSFPKRWSNIRDGKQTIRGARMFSSNLESFSSEYVFVEKSESAGKGYGSDDVILIHQNDTIVVSGQSVQDVLNEVLEILDFYDNWETKLLWDVAHNCSLQTLVEHASQAMRGLLIISDRRGNNLASSSYNTENIKDPVWRRTIETGEIHPSVSSSAIINEKGEVVQSWSNQPQLYYMGDYRYIGSRIQLDKETLCSVCAISFTEPLETVDLQLFQVLYDLVETMAKSLRIIPEIQTKAITVEALLKGNSPELYHIERLDEHLKNQKPYGLLVLRTNTGNYDEMHQVFLSNQLSKYFPQCIALDYENQVVCVLNRSAVAKLPGNLTNIINMNHYSIGLSMPFDDWQSLPLHYHQASEALNQAKKPKQFCRFQDIAYGKMLAQLRTLNENLQILHPALKLLKKQDTQTKSDLYHTLEEYLKNDRSMTASARRLHIHVNTMKYRVQQILDLTGIDLQNEEERIYLLISYLIEEPE